ncbi:MAG: hypothetical protein HOK61_07410 [Alphaproteobacteria bacterium]|nr:hypothetical protein [Alphaproteobacteria bacterium]
MGGAGKAEATSFLRGDDQDGPAYLDKGDPNYCPDEDEEGIVLVSSGRDSLPPGSPKREAYDPEGGGGVPPAMALAGDGSQHIPDLAAFKLAAATAVTERVGAHAAPDHVFAVDALPKTITNKTARKTLQLLLAGEAAPDGSLAKKETLPPIAAMVADWRLTGASTSHASAQCKSSHTCSIGSRSAVSRAIIIVRS